MAHRHCHAGGYWDNTSDYDACIEIFRKMDETTTHPAGIDRAVSCHIDLSFA